MYAMHTHLDYNGTGGRLPYLAIFSPRPAIASPLLAAAHATTDELVACASHNPDHHCATAPLHTSVLFKQCRTKALLMCMQHEWVSKGGLGCLPPPLRYSSFAQTTQASRFLRFFRYRSSGTVFCLFSLSKLLFQATAIFATSLYCCHSCCAHSSR